MHILRLDKKINLWIVLIFHSYSSIGDSKYLIMNRKDQVKKYLYGHMKYYNCMASQ